MVSTRADSTSPITTKTPGKARSGPPLWEHHWPPVCPNILSYVIAESGHHMRQAWDLRTTALQLLINGDGKGASAGLGLPFTPMYGCWAAPKNPRL